MTTPIIENTILGTAFSDDLLGLNGADAIAGRGGDDVIRGGGGSDLLLGNEGNDNIDGGTGRDTIYGGVGDDFLSGGAGGDWLSGDEGTDVLRGGSGSDTFYFNGKTAAAGADTITDFSVTDGDLISFGKYVEGTTVAFTQQGANVEITVDVNGDLVADYLMATVLNATVADVDAAFSFVV